MANPRVTRQFYASLSRRSKFTLEAAIFFLFAPLGISIDIAGLGTNPMPFVLAFALLSGTIAVLYARGGFTGRIVFYFSLGLALQFGTAWLLRQLSPRRPVPTALDEAGLRALDNRLELDAILLMACVLAGYGMFITLWSREGGQFFSRGTEIRLAQRIHQKLVPDVNGRTAHVEWAGFSRASGEIGGDLVDAIEGPAGVVACVADVSGHGVGAGLLMGMFKTAFRAAAEETSEPSVILARTHVTLTGLTEPNMYITAAVARIDGRSLYLAGGGHPPVLIYRKATGRVEQIASTGPAIALLDDFSCRTIPLTLERGDLALLLTDGITEALDANGSEVGLDGVCGAIAAHADAPLDTLLGKVAALATRGARADDQTLLAVRAL